MVFELIVALALVIANGFFVASEFALVRLRLTEATEMEGAGRAGARSARHAVEHLDAYLAACQLGITLASIGLGVVGKPAFEALLHPIFAGGASIAGFGVAATLAFLIITLLHVVVGAAVDGYDVDQDAPREVSHGHAGARRSRVEPGSILGGQA